MDDTRDDELDELIHRADLDGLVRLIDARTTGRDWDGLARVRRAARAAVLTGRQVWPAATLAEYRLALWAPAEWAATALSEEGGRFTIGPLPEVAAQHHQWADLAPFLEPGPRANVVAHERVLRGETIADPPPGPNPFDLPYELAAWEPEYPLPVYSDDGVEAPAPDRPNISGTLVTADPAGPGVDPSAVDDAVHDLLRAWTVTSGGSVRLGVGASVAEALGAVVGPDVEVRLAGMPPADAVAWLTWAGASGAAHGRRPGAAAGRFGAMWLLAALDDALDDWPLPLDELGEIAASLRWAHWDLGTPDPGWVLRLVIEDPVNGVAWAIDATHSANT